MSRITLAPNASGTGTLTVAAPNTNTDRTLTLPDATGTVIYSDTSGNVGIGTSSPTQKLEVAGNIQLPNSGVLAFYDAGGTARNCLQFLSGELRLAGAGAGVTTQTIYTNGSERMRIDSSGNVGIGTSSPSASYKLDVSGSVGASGSVTIGTSGTYAAGSIYSDTNWGMIFRAKQASPALAEFKWGNSADTERMRINTSGQLLVGTASAFDTVSFLTAQFYGGCATFQNTALASSQVSFFNTNGRVGFISTTGSATTYSTSSDYRLKENVQPMVGALDKIAQLNPVTYNWKSDGSDGQGFIAHELQAVVPDCVSGEKDAVDDEGNPKHQGVDTSFLVATLVKAVQEQQQMIQALQADIAALKGV